MKHLLFSLLMISSLAAFASMDKQELHNEERIRALEKQIQVAQESLRQTDAPSELKEVLPLLIEAYSREISDIKYRGLNAPMITDRGSEKSAASQF